MSVIELKPDLLPDIQKYGAFDVSACFNCGNCTAICPLSETDGEFPRSIIRLAQLGAKDELLDSKELWLCYYCGECSATCPRQAEPGEFMAAARRYAIAHYDVTGISRLLYKSKAFYAAFLVILAAIALAIMWPFSHLNATPEEGINPAWTYLDPEFAHWGGMIAGGIFGVIMLVYFFNLYKHLMRQYKNYGSDTSSLSFGTKFNVAIKSLFTVIFTEILYQKRYATDQNTEKPFLIRRWVMHLSMIWGFILLFTATAINFISKPIEKMVPIYYPTHIIGIIGGILLVYGATMTLIFHATQRDDKFYASANFSDGVFLILTDLLGISGLLLTLVIYVPTLQDLAYYFVVFHLMIVGMYIVLAPINKGAHAFYRPFTLWIYQYAKDIEALTTPAEDETMDEIPILA